MLANLSLSRVRLPKRKAENYLRRRRLLDLLHRSIERKLTFISASAGYGKTSLLIDFASDIDAAVCWYSVASSHNDLATFAQHLIASIQQNFPAFAGQLQSSDTSALTDTGSLVVALTNEMIANVTDFCLLVIDDFHLVGETYPIVEFVEALIEHLPEHVRIIIASRSYYGVPTLSLDTDQELGLISQKELRFRPDEIQTLVRQINHVGLTHDQAMELAQQVDGWIVAVLLAARTPIDNVVARLKGVTQSIYSFLANEVLGQQPPGLQRFLLATSIVDEFDADLCTHLLAPESIAAYLQELQDRNLFVTQTETDTSTTYQYHQLFSDFLREQLVKLDPEWAFELHSRTAEWYTAQGKWDAASRHWLNAKQPERAVEVMDRAAPALYVAGHTQTLSKWGSQLSPQMLSQAPQLTLAYAKVLINQGAHDQDKIETLLNFAEEESRREGDKEQVAHVLVTRGMLRRSAHRFEEALVLAREAEALTASIRGYRWLQARRLQGICLTNLGKAEAAAEVLETVAEAFRAAGPAHDLAETLIDLAVAYQTLGNIFRTQACYLEVLDIRRPTGGARLMNAFSNAGYVYHLTGQYKEAWKCFEQGYRIAQSITNDRATSLLLESRGNFLRDLEEWEEARKAYNQSQALALKINDAELLAYSSAGLLEIERRQGNFSEALHWLRETARHRNQSENSPDYQISLGLIYLSMGQVSLAEEALESAAIRLRKVARPSEKLALTEFGLAQALARRSVRKRAIRHLQQALMHSARLGYDQFLVMAARQAPTLREFVKPEDLTSGQDQWRFICRQAVDFRPGIASLVDTSQSPEQARTIHVELFAFGKEQVRRDGEAVGHWGSMGARALFCFICERKLVDRDLVGLEFWPDFSPAKIASNFHATLWRARKAVGADLIVFEDDTYRLAPTVVFWADADEFESRIKQAKNVNLTADERGDLLRQAVQLYRGPYLMGITMGWAEDRRRSLTVGFLSSLIGLGKWELERKRNREAQEWFERALSEDNLDEEATFGLMTALSGLTETGKARALFLDYKKRLRDELGETPSGRIQQLYSSLG